MSTYLQLTIQQKGLKSDFVRRTLEKNFPEACITIVRKESQASRPARFAAMKELIDAALEECEALYEELESWHDNLPENLQASEKANQLQEAIDSLNEISMNLADASSNEVEFPGMF